MKIDDPNSSKSMSSISIKCLFKNAFLSSCGFFVCDCILIFCQPLHAIHFQLTLSWNHLFTLISIALKLAGFLKLHWSQIEKENLHLMGPILQFLLRSYRFIPQMLRVVISKMLAGHYLIVRCLCWTRYSNGLSVQ